MSDYMEIVRMLLVGVAGILFGKFLVWMTKREGDDDR